MAEGLIHFSGDTQTHLAGQEVDYFPIKQ
jgi:hypothetical protein